METESNLPVVWKRDTGGSGSRGVLLSLVLWVWKATRAHFTDGKDEDPWIELLFRKTIEKGDVYILNPVAKFMA